MAYLLGTDVQFPEHYYSQDKLLDALLELWGDKLYNPERLRTFFRNVEVGGRYLAFPKERYAELDDFGKKNLAFREAALELSESLLLQLESNAGFKLSEVGTLVSTTVTGLSVPTLEARLMNRLDFSPYLKRVPLFGLGCLAGAAGIARLNDLCGDSDEVGLLLAVELCSLTLQTKDISIANLISTGLFGDGAGAVLMAGSNNEMARSLAADGKACRIVATRSVVFPDSEGVMGWEFDGDGFQIVLNSQVPEYAKGPVCQELVKFLAEHDLTSADIQHWLAHPGGPKVIDAMEEGLSVPGALQASRESLSEIGNLSSVSVLTILDKVMKSGQCKKGDWGLLMAMGPAFCAEFVLLKWGL